MSDVPEEVVAISRRWAGLMADMTELVPGARWGLLAEDGMRYEVTRPGHPFPCFEDSGRPCGSIVLDEWAVRCTTDAPDGWFTVDARQMAGLIADMRPDEDEL